MTPSIIQFWKKEASWDEIGETLTIKFNICSCQRKLKSIVDNMYSIYIRLEERNFTFTGAEWLIIAMMDKNSDAVSHGVNSEYPILMKHHEFWEWIIAVKDNPNLSDN